MDGLKVALLLPGQGSQQALMGISLYGHDPVYTTAFLRVLALSKHGRKAHKQWKTGKCIDDTEYAQPLIFATDYALSQMVISWGVKPSLFIGHSAGELVAAVLAESLTLRQGVRIMDDRVDHAPYAPRGGMVAVACSAQAIVPHLVDGVDIAADNAPRQIMIAGPDKALEEVTSGLDNEGLAYSVVPANTPFHSEAMESVARRHLAICQATEWRTPKTPVISGYLGEYLTKENINHPEFWAQQVQKRVNFRTALLKAFEHGNWLFIEAGAGITLTSFAKRTPQVRSGDSAAVSLLAGTAADGEPASRRARRILESVTR